MKHYKLKITGRVQGVWYRGSAQNKARQLNIKGFAKNESDGSVYIEAEGSEEQLLKFVAWCRKGPEMAIVENVQISEGELKNYKYFDIKF